MPQFDKITFFNQVFWLFFFFSGFYLIILKVFLPRLSSILKARTTLLEVGLFYTFYFMFLKRMVIAVLKFQYSRKFFFFNESTVWSIEHLAFLIKFHFVLSRKCCNYRRILRYRRFVAVKIIQKQLAKQLIASSFIGHPDFKNRQF